MIVTVQKKEQRVIKVPSNLPNTVIGSRDTDLSLGQLKQVDISQAETGDVLMFTGTSWGAQPLDGGEFE